MEFDFDKLSVGFSGTPKDMGPLTHTIPISLGILMGVVWEQYGKLTIRRSHYWESLESPLKLFDCMIRGPFPTKVRALWWYGSLTPLWCK